MLKSQAISQIKRRLGFRSDLDAEILEELRNAQERFENFGVPLGGSSFIPQFLMTEIADISTENNEERVRVPTDILVEDEAGALWRFDSGAEVGKEWTELVKMDFDTMRREFPGKGPPQVYTADGLYFRLGPVPDGSYRLRMRYLAKDAVLEAADTENKWLKNAPQLLIGEAGVAIAVSTGYAAAASYFEMMRKEAAIALWGREETKFHVNRRYVMGGLS